MFTDAKKFDPSVLSTIDNWFEKIPSDVILLFGTRDSGIPMVLDEILKRKVKDTQAIIIDIQRTWYPDIKDPRLIYLQPKSKEELIQSIRDLNSMLTPRLSLIIIDGLPYFYRDYQGRMAKDTIVNKRLYAYSLHLFSKLAQHPGIIVLCTSFASGYETDKPVMNEVNLYYQVQVTQVVSDEKINFIPLKGKT